MKIYTKTGDKGTTMLGNGKRVSKSSLRVQAYGNIDELNCVIGVVVSAINTKEQSIINQLIDIQKDLFEIGASLAKSNKANNALNDYLGKRVNDFEKEIDLISKKLPGLTNFIIPGGGNVGAMLHLGRTVCRRAERRIVEVGKKEKIQEQMIIYLNRLSDLLFVMARFVNLKEKKKETVWFKK
ncbi:cob(I)yrinic acid a,c-diamide adenosyltransferase [Patescibacteria group bacterium]|nr:cob(I)yrinic acid a,c-diamide adenosyltransferase [Patescibacteria group bacterium]